MAKTKAKAKKKKTLEERKLDALVEIGKRLAGIEKLIGERFPAKDNRGYVDDDFDEDFDED